MSTPVRLFLFTLFLHKHPCITQAAHCLEINRKQYVWINNISELLVFTTTLLLQLFFFHSFFCVVDVICCHCNPECHKCLPVLYWYRNNNQERSIACIFFSIALFDSICWLWYTTNYYIADDYLQLLAVIIIIKTKFLYSNYYIQTILLYHRYVISTMSNIYCG